MESILKFIRQSMLGNGDIDAFDVDLIMDINVAFMTLTQLGVGPPEGFFIKDESAVWSDFIDEDSTCMGAVQAYVRFKVKILFDPPSNSALLESYNNQLADLEYRLNLDAEIIQQGGKNQNGE